MTAPPTNTALQDALALHRQGKHELAMQRYVSVLQTDPKNLDALYYVAVLAIQQGVSQCAGHGWAVPFLPF